MAGKFTPFKNSLQRRTDSTPYGLKVQQRKDELVEEKTDTELAERIKVLARRAEILERASKATEFESNATEKALADKLETEKKDGIKLESGGSFTIQHKIYPSIKDPDSFNKWIYSNNLEAFLTMHHKRLESIVSDALVNGNPMPDGVEVFMDVRIGKRGIKGGAEDNG